ncbi:MAG TPA: phosphatase PAP2 family protein [Caldilineaceae bacterium]|nr:phosphatase PAP2 family protein [Caldilineaceae bacterium]
MNKLAYKLEQWAARNRWSQLGWQRSRALVKGFWARVELNYLIALLLIAAGVWVFLALAGEVVEGDTHAFDEAVLLALRNPHDHADPLGPPWVEEMGRDLTALGGTAILALVTAGVAGYLVLVRRWTMAWLVALAVVGGALINMALKAGFDRPRPDLVPHYTVIYNASFPSGHSMLAATIYLTLGALLARLQRSRRMAAYIMAVAIIVTVLVGLSRVYLGVHWPTDVIAGWAAGAVWAVLCLVFVWWLQQRWQTRRQRKELAEIAPESTEQERAVERAIARHADT